MKRSLILITILVLLPCLAFSLMNFPKIIWMYWQTNFDEAPLITRVTYQKMSAAAKQVNWTVNLVTGKNIHEFVENITEFQDVVRKGRRKTVQQKSDLLRIWLVEENGGVWIDFAAIPYQNFDWLMNYTSYQHMIINRIGTNLDDPEMFMLGQGAHQSPLSQYNSDGVLVTDEYFGMAIHFIAGKKKTRLMTEWKNKMKSLSSMTWEQMLPEWKQHRLWFHFIDRGDVYYNGNLALQTTIQKRQFEIDRNLTLFSKRLSVYEYYKLWCIHGQVGPIGLSRKQIFKPSDLFLRTLQQVQARAGPQRFYVKINRTFRDRIMALHQQARQFMQKQNKKIEQIINGEPNHQLCQIHFIVEGSILHNFYKGSKYFDQLKVPIITKEQRDTLREKCIPYNPWEYVPLYDLHGNGNLVSPQRQMYAKDTSIKTQIWVWWVTHSLSIHAWMQRLQQPIMLLAFYGILKLFFGDLLKKLVKKNNPENANDLNQKQLNQQDTFETQENKRSSLKFETIFAIMFVILMYMTFYQLFSCIQQQGKFPMYNYVAFMALIMVLMNEFTKRTTKYQKSEANWFISLSTLNLASRMFLLIFAGHCILMHFHNMWFYAYRDVLQIVGMGYLLYVIFSELQSRKLVNNKIHDFIVYFMGKILPWTIVIFLCLIVFWRNPMYLTSGDHYLRLGFINAVRTFFDIFSKLSIVYFFIVLVRNIYKSIRQKQTKNGISPKKRIEESILFIIISFCWLVTYLRIFSKYEQLEERLAFSHLIFMKYFMVHFAVFDFAIRLRMPMSLELRYRIIFYLLSLSFVVLFCTQGFQFFMEFFRDGFYNKVLFQSITLLLAFLALLREVFQKQQNISSMGKNSYQQIQQSLQVQMSNVKIQN